MQCLTKSLFPRIAPTTAKPLAGMIRSLVNSILIFFMDIHEVGDGNMYAEKASTSLREVVDGIQAIADSAKK